MVVLRSSTWERSCEHAQFGVRFQGRWSCRRNTSTMLGCASTLVGERPCPIRTVFAQLLATCCVSFLVLVNEEAHGILTDMRLFAEPSDRVHVNKHQHQHHIINKPTTFPSPKTQAVAEPISPSTSLRRRTQPLQDIETASAANA